MVYATPWGIRVTAITRATSMNEAVAPLACTAVYAVRKDGLIKIGFTPCLR